MATRKQKRNDTGTLPGIGPFASQALNDATTRKPRKQRTVKTAGTGHSSRNPDVGRGVGTPAAWPTSPVRILFRADSSEHTADTIRSWISSGYAGVDRRIGCPDRRFHNVPYLVGFTYRRTGSDGRRKDDIIDYSTYPVYYTTPDPGQRDDSRDDNDRGGCGSGTCAF